MHRWAVVFALLVASCRDCSEPARPLGDAAADAGEPLDAGADGHVLIVPTDPACEGMKLSLFDAVMNARCAVTDEEFNAPSPSAVAQEARAIGGDGGPDEIEFALVNRGATSASIPLRFDDRHPERAFEVIAEMMVGKGVYTLEPPKLVLHESDAGVHVHSARIRLPPGGRATARLVLDRRPRERLDKHVDAGASLPPGAIRAHIGQTMSPAEMGDPATVVVRPLP